MQKTNKNQPDIILSDIKHNDILPLVIKNINNLEAALEFRKKDSYKELVY